jgi:hypothetical protein
MDLNGVIQEAIKWSPAAWLENYGKIERKGGELVRPKVNEYQRKISAVVEWCHQHGRPCRIVALKPRQKGSSTFSVATAYRRLLAKRGRGLIAGGAHFQGANLFRILRTYAENDELDPKKCKVMDMDARFTNGSSMERITLANSNAGRSGTYQVLVITEVAYLSEEGVANATNVLNGLLKCVPYEPDTIIIQESTAKGASGDFYETFEGGVTFEEFKAGRNGYIKIFSPWYEFEDSRMPAASEGIHSEADLTEQERELAAKWSLDLDQVAWMRWAIREECKGDFDRFVQDYPFDPETCFLKSGRGRFNSDGLRHQKEIAKIRPCTFGVVEMNYRRDAVSFRPCAEEEAKVVMWEKPRVGCRYLVSVDPMTGASQTGGIDPDSHSVFVHRAGYIDAGNGKWVEPAVVMRNMLFHDGLRFGCWWDIDVLEEEVYRMARYYGGAMIVPEMNMDRGLVELLKLRPDANVYEREMFNRREGITTNALGWMTDTKTRPMIIENLARSVRESGRGVAGVGFEIRCPWAIKQLENFVVKTNGRAEAAQGHHDDDVLSLAIGHQLIEQATVFFEETRDEWLPPDLRPKTGARVMGRAQYG